MGSRRDHAVVFLFSAGHQTTRDLIGNGLVALLSHPGGWARLLDEPSLASAAVEECLRYDPPVTIVPRRALEDVVVGDTVIRSGDRILASISAAHRDPERFEDPDSFIIDRSGNDHSAFGGGIHYSLGASLARVETQIVLTTLLNKYPRLALSDRPIEWRNTFAFRGPIALPVVLKG